MPTAPDRSPPSADRPPVDPVRLSVPASPRYLSAARVVAASLGAESGLTVDDLDDLRLGVNELVSLLVEASEPAARIDLEFDAADGAVTVRGRVDGDVGPVDVDELTERIVGTVTDHYALDGTSFSLTKVTSLRD